MSFDFILLFFLSKNISMLTAFLSLDQSVLNNFKGALEIARKSFNLGVRFRICYNFETCEDTSTYSGGIVLDLSCERAKQILNESSNKRLFDVLHTWLIVDNDDLPNSTKIDFFMEDLDILPDSNVMWSTKKSLLDIYRVNKKEKLMLRELYGEVNASSTADLTSLWFTLPSHSTSRKNLQNIYLRASAVLTEPQYFTGWEDLSTKHIDTWPKFTFPLMKYLAQDLMFKIDMKQTDKYGVKQLNGSFTGLSGQFQRGEIEFGIASMFMRKDRFDIVDFCAETILLKSLFMFRQPSKSTVSNIFILPFETEVWIASLSTFFLVGLVMTLLTKLMRKADHSLKALNTSEILSFTIGTVCQQGTHLNPYLSSVRVMIFFSFVTSLFIFTSYSAKIVALLQTPSTAIKTISDLAHSPMTLGVQDSTYKKLYFTESNDPATKFLYKYKIASQGENAYMSIVDGIGRMKNSIFAFQVEASSGYAIISKTYTEREKCGLAEIEAFQLPMVSVPIKKRSGYRELFASRLRWQREVGLLDRTRRIWIAQKPICNEGLTGFVSVGITECLPAVKIMMYGAILSMFVFIYEQIISRFGRYWKGKV